MYCLEKFQRELAHFLDIDLRDLPKVQEILKAQGYTAVKKNDEIIELGSARQSFLEKIPADIAPSTFTKQEIEKLLTQFDNIENLTQHLNTRADSQARQELFHLLESTKNNPNIHYTKDSKDKYLKRFKDNDEHDPYFYLLITKDKDKTFITHLKTRDLNYLEKEILNAESIVKGADIIGDFRQQAGSAKHKSPTSTADSTTNKVFNQIKNAENAKDIIPQPNKQTFQAYKQSLESQGIPIENEVKSFINFVEKNIYNENGVSFNQLNNALKTLNSYYKEAKDPNFKNHIKNAMDSFLREDIKAGIEAIFSQNKSAYKDISSLYATALSDYADMKEVLKIADKLKIRNATTEQNKALDSLLKLAKGQGDKLDNISSLTKALDKDNRALIELNMLSGLFQKSLYDENALQVIDSGKFFKELQALHKDTFQSKEAQDFINIMSDFDRLFKNDILIAKALKPTTTGQIGSSIATSIEGAVKFQMVKNAFSHLVRLMPHIPFMSGLNQKVQGAALRYHLQKALESSFSVSELKHTLQNRIAKAPYTSQTKSQIEKILNRVDTIQDELIEVAERNAKQAQNAKDLQEYQTLQKYGVESLEKLSQDDFNHFVDSVLSGDIEALKSAPNIVYIADLNAELAKELGLNNGKIFLRKNDLHHFRPERKVEYDQAVPREIIKEIPNIINNTPLAYKDPLHNNFFITKELNQVEVMKIAINKDSEGNYIITLSKVEKSSIENQGLEAVGLAPTIPNLNDEAYRTTMLPPSTSKPSDIIPQNPTKAQSEYFNSLTNEYEKIKEIKKLHTQDDVLVRVMKINDRYIEPLSNMSVSKEYLQKQTAQSLKENITQAILGNQTQLKALQQGYNTYHLSPFQKEVLESVLDIANNPTKLKEYKLQGLQKQLDNLNNNEAYHIEKGREYDKSRYAKDRQELEKEISALKGESSDIIFTDKKGKEHTLTKEVQEQWCETFNLKSLDESYIPQLPQELQEAIGREIKLTKGSLYKIIEKGREQYIPQIKETLEKPDFALRDTDNMLIIAKEIGDKQYFTSINLETKDYFISISNAPKKENILKNKVENGAKVVYQSPNAKSIFYTDTLLQEGKSPTNKIDSTIIPQQTLESTMQKFNYDEKKAKDLLEWHKDSSPLTKDENGVPKAENMLESSNKILGETMTLKDRLLIDNKIKYSYLKEIAQDLPKPITKDDFLHLLKNKKYVNIQTPIKELEIEPLKAYEHLTQNSNKQNRIDISGAILPTLQNPLFITKDKKDTYYFYKPFKDEKGVLNIVSIAIPKSNRIRYKTSYIASRERMLKMINEYELVYEAF